MSDLIDLPESFPVMARPFSASRSSLGTVTKLYSSQFLCNESGVLELYTAVSERLAYLAPKTVGFQFMVSFDDRTHFEHQNIDEFIRVLRNNGKTTERLILKWVVTHELEGETYEVTVLVRISNPVNPFLYLQAALSKSADEIDNLELESGAMSASIDGASQITAENLFSAIGSWVDSRPQPQYVTDIHEKISKHSEKIGFLNHWLLPILVASIFFVILWKHTTEALVFPVLFLAIVVNQYLRSITTVLNSRVERWCRISAHFSVFSLTGGDQNQQAKFASRSKNGLIKLVLTTTLTFLSNIAAGIAVAWLYGA